MRKYTYADSGYTFERVDKKTARKAYNNGLRVILCPCNLRPGYPFHPEISISGKAQATFEEALNAFEFYNIRNAESGFYTAFYIPVVEVETIKQYDYRYIGGVA